MFLVSQTVRPPHPGRRIFRGILAVTILSAYTPAFMGYAQWSQIGAGGVFTIVAVTSVLTAISWLSLGAIAGLFDKRVERLERTHVVTRLWSTALITLGGMLPGAFNAYIWGRPSFGHVNFLAALITEAVICATAAWIFTRWHPKHYGRV